MPNFTKITIWDSSGGVGAQRWVFNNDSSQEILGAVSGDTLHIKAIPGGYPLVNGYRWRVGIYNITNVALAYGTQSGNHNMVQIDSTPVEDASGVQVTASTGFEVLTDATGFLNAEDVTPLVAGTLDFVSRTGTTVTLTETIAGSGGPGYTTKLHRTATPNGAISGGTVVQTGAGPWTVTPGTTSLGYYIVEYTDDTSSPKTSNICAASTVNTPLPTLPTAGVAFPEDIATVGYGDSNVFQGAYNAIPTILESIDTRNDATYTNTGVGGTTAAQWATDSTLYNPTLTAIATGLSASRTVAVVQLLGTNDMRGAITANAYEASIRTSVARFLTAGASIVILMEPAYCGPGHFDSVTNANLPLLQAYAAKLALIAADDPTHVVYVPGLYRYIADHQNLINLPGGDGVHFGPNTDVAARFAVIGIDSVTTPRVTEVALSPGTATVGGLATQQFTPTVSVVNGASQAVTYSRVSGVGTINSSGLYTAPAAIIGVAQAAVVRATSVFDTTQHDDSAITIPASTTPGGTVVYSVVAMPLRVTDTDGSAPGQYNNGRFEYFVGDSAPSRAIQIVDANGNPKDLTGTTVEYRLSAMDGSSTSTSGDTTVYSAPGGLVRHDLETSDTAASGRFRESWRITWGDGRVTTVGGDIIIEVKE